MLKLLRVKNFKGWSDTGTINMAPISLFLGANSSGKSSIGQFLMMLKQTVESPDRKAVFYTGGKNSVVQLGSFKDIVFHHNPENKIGFDYEWRFQDPLKIKDPITGNVYTGSTLSFEASVGLKDEQNNSLIVDFLKYRLKTGDKQVLAVKLTHKGETKSGYEADAEDYDLIRKKMRAWSLKDTVRFYGFPDEVVAYYQNADFVQELNLQHEKLFQSLCYLGPLRNKPERLYSWGGVSPESVGFSGEHTIAAILAAKDRKIGLGKNRPISLLKKSSHMNLR